MFSHITDFRHWTDYILGKSHHCRGNANMHGSSVCLAERNTFCCCSLSDAELFMWRYRLAVVRLACLIVRSSELLGNKSDASLATASQMSYLIRKRGMAFRNCLQKSINIWNALLSKRDYFRLCWLGKSKDKQCQCLILSLTWTVNVGFPHANGNRKISIFSKDSIWIKHSCMFS